MRRAVVVVGLVAAMVVATWASAGQERKRDKGKRKGESATGLFVSAELAGEKTNWKITTEDDQAEKTFEMAAKVVVMYMERQGQNVALNIRPLGKRVPEAKGKRLVAQGTFVKAELQGNKVVVTVNVGEGDAAEKKDFALSSRVRVAYRAKKDGTIAAMSISGAGGKGKREGRQKDKKKKDE